MRSLSRFLVMTLSTGMIGLMSFTASTSLYADQSYNKYKRSDKAERYRDRDRGQKHKPSHKAERYPDRYREQKHRRPHHRPNRPHVIHHGPPHRIRPDRVRRHRDVIIVRPHGHWYHGYGWHRRDHDAFKWLAFTAITLKLLDNLNEDQQRAHEAAQIRATEAAVGETVYWNRDGASGSVKVLRDGTSTTGRYCREFQQEVTIGGQGEAAYGTACRNSDGSWEVVSTGSP